VKLTQLAAKPQLIRLVLDTPDVIERYQEPLEFYTWDRQPLDVFVKLAQINNSNIGDVIDIVRTMILDESGNQVIQNDVMLPSQVLIQAIGKITDTLGK
jgi:hypothetical protein